MTDMCLRIDGLPQATKGYTLLPFQGEQWYERHYPGCRFALPWAMGYCPFGACSQMHVYDDHLEIWNEGELPVGYTILTEKQKKIYHLIAASADITAKQMAVNLGIPLRTLHERQCL